MIAINNSKKYKHHYIKQQKQNSIIHNGGKSESKSVIMIDLFVQQKYLGKNKKQHLCVARHISLASPLATPENFIVRNCANVLWWRHAHNL